VAKKRDEGKIEVMMMEKLAEVLGGKYERRDKNKVER